jgi:RNA-binding protein NOB1
VSSPSASPDAEPKLQVHLKRNFQWRNRGTKYSIPAPKSGSSKTGAGEGLILREDQTEWVRAEKRAEGRRQKEEKKMISAISNSNGSGGVKLDWMDPDWLPEMLVVGAGGKGRNTGRGDMPPVGYGRKNPNERKRRKR